MLLKAEASDDRFRIIDLQLCDWLKVAAASADLSGLKRLTLNKPGDLDLAFPNAIDEVDVRFSVSVRDRDFALLATATQKKLTLKRLSGPIEELKTEAKVSVDVWTCPGNPSVPANVRVREALLDRATEPLQDIMRRCSFEVVHCTLSQFNDLEPPEGVAFVIKRDDAPSLFALDKNPHAFFKDNVLWTLQGILPDPPGRLDEVTLVVGWQRGAAADARISEEEQEWLRGLDVDRCTLHAPTNKAIPKGAFGPPGASKTVYVDPKFSEWSLERFLERVKLLSE